MWTPKNSVSHLLNENRDGRMLRGSQFQENFPESSQKTDSPGQVAQLVGMSSWYVKTPGSIPSQNNIQESPN